MQVKVTDHLDRLEADLGAVPTRVYQDGVRIVRDGIKLGSQLARDNARRTARRHGKHYPNAITPEMKMVSPGFGLIVGEYGPDASKRQGRMSFEDGSRNQPPHRDLAKSADIIGPAFAGEIRSQIPSWFW
jgi:hypothetical protein